MKFSTTAKSLALIAGVLVVSAIVGYSVLAVWNPPTADPTDGNPDPPITGVTADSPLSGATNAGEVSLDLSYNTGDFNIGGSGFQLHPDRFLNWDTDVNDDLTATLQAGKWCTSDGATINCTADDPNFSFTEADPIFTASPAAGITGTNISNWNTAYGWGNHALAGYLTSYTETDPQVGALTANKWCTANAAGSAVVCASDAPAGGLWLVNGAHIYNSNTGNVGIGTGAAAPNDKLEVNGNIRAGEKLKILEKSGGGWPAIEFYNQALALKGYIVYGISEGLMAFNSEGTTAMNIKGGNVGIGTNLPDAPLEIKSSTDGILRLRQNEGGYNYIEYYNDSVRTLWLGMQTNSLFSINYQLYLNTANGNIGIGLTDPGAKLTVTTDTGKKGSAGDTIYAYANSTNAALSAEQANSSGYAGYFSGRVLATSLAGSGTRMVTADASGILGAQAIPVGDITGVTAGTGLTGGGTSGSPTLNLNTGGISSCTNDTNQKILWDSGNNRLTCGTDQTGGGTSPWLSDTNGIYYNSGSVGIGKDNPQDTLDVKASALGTGILITGVNGTNGSAQGAIQFSDGNNNPPISRIVAYRGTGYTRGDLAFEVRNGGDLTEALRIDQTGNIDMSGNLTVTGDITAGNYPPDFDGYDTYTESRYCTSGDGSDYAYSGKYYPDWYCSLYWVSLGDVDGGSEVAQCFVRKSVTNEWYVEAEIADCGDQWARCGMSCIKLK